MLKKNVTCVCAALAALFVAVAPASAGAAGGDTKAKIPFEFVAGGKIMPAGNYTLEINAGRPLVSIRGETGVTTLTFVSRHVGAGGREIKPKLVFYKLGGKYVLTELWEGATPVSERGK